MNTKKIVIKPAPRGYTQIDLPVKKTVRISNMFIPFGMNSNYTIKLQFSKDITFFSKYKTCLFQNIKPHFFSKDKKNSPFFQKIKSVTFKI